MINVEYTNTSEETANATLDFLINRPILSFALFFMKASCALLCIGFAIAVYTKAARPQDLASVISALLWLFFYKPINRWVIKRNLKKRKLNLLADKFKIDQKSIACKLNTAYPLNVEWKKIKYLLKNKDGYIIPLTGISNAGKFLWLPTRGFENKNMEDEFVALVQKFKLKIKNITKG